MFAFSAVTEKSGKGVGDGCWVSQPKCLGVMTPYTYAALSVY